MVWSGLTQQADLHVLTLTWTKEEWRNSWKYSTLAWFISILIWGRAVLFFVSSWSNSQRSTTPAEQITAARAEPEEAPSGPESLCSQPVARTVGPPQTTPPHIPAALSGCTVEHSVRPAGLNGWTLRAGSSDAARRRQSETPETSAGDTEDVNMDRSNPSVEFTIKSVNLNKTPQKLFFSLAFIVKLWCWKNVVSFFQNRKLRWAVTEKNPTQNNLTQFV